MSFTRRHPGMTSPWMHGQTVMPAPAFTAAPTDQLWLMRIATRSSGTFFVITDPAANTRGATIYPARSSSRKGKM